MKHKVSELEGALLDAAVAKAEGASFHLDLITTTSGSPWVCSRDDGRQCNSAKSPAALISAMRAFVASKFGEEIELP